MQKIVTAVNQNLLRSYEGIKRFGKLERILAALCLFIPLLLILFQDGPIRGSISEYYNMDNSQVYYFSLTVASMLFIVNGVIKKQRSYNTILGLMLAGLILFNVHSTLIIHSVFAIAFFGGNAVVIVVFSSKKERWFKILMVAIALFAMVCFMLNWFSLFWAEWISFAIISLHYLLESWGVID